MMALWIRMVGGVPVLGPLSRRIYRVLRRGEGRTYPIRNGPLAGLRYRRFLWSTGDPHMVETNWESGPLLEIAIGQMKEARMFFDIGSNWGYYLLLASRHISSEARVVGFEAHPRTAAQSRIQLDMNCVRNTEVVQVALSDSLGEVEFSDIGSSQTQGIVGLQAVTTGLTKTIKVPAITLDEAARRYGDPDFVKIDVEGAELVVLRGGREMLGRAHPVIVMELHVGVASGDIIDILTQLGYRLATPVGGPVSASDSIDVPRQVVAWAEGSSPPTGLHLVGES